MLKTLSIVAFSVSAIVMIAAAFAAAVPDHEVEFSAKTGQCKKVEHQGVIVPDGCNQVATGKIARYTTIQGY